MKIIRSEIALAPNPSSGDDGESHLPEGLRGKSLMQLANIVYNAIKRFGIDPSWGDLHDYRREDIIDHINQMCNEFGLNVGVTGQLFKV